MRKLKLHDRPLPGMAEVFDLDARHEALAVATLLIGAHRELATTPSS